ncbi:LacI family DNA-binding transcriptional regulator [Clostridium oryzae]|uniref:HTH-type transcriptional regulator DegA n=1 Tax=Clostridium oryzae TaxID=1450648 RepID=A0A1V4IJW7_9CLOT|nr:LacI family DNA-binding transcriptional regulator [Clostridium oryzae]OPJ60216.1 HTH-type transcriptional regulator DegA [Clostridium oryzae]
MSVTIKDIARLAEVSVTTVSKIINNKDNDISETTKTRVKNIIKEYNYIPNKLAQSMITKKTKTIGLIIPDVRNPFFTELVRGAEDKASEKDYNLIFCNSDDDIKKEIKYINALVEKMVDGIVLAAAVSRDKNLETQISIPVPVIAIDRETNINGIKGFISIDSYRGAYDAIKYLIELGHKDILVLSGPLNLSISRYRLQGYKDALEDNGLKYDDNNVFVGDFQSDWAVGTVGELIGKRDFTAIFCGNDLIALGAIKALKKNNIKVPEQVSVVGFDDITVATMVTPELTTVKQPNYEMGYMSVEMIIDILEGKKNGENIVLSPKLKIRNSTCRRKMREESISNRKS